MLTILIVDDNPTFRMQAARLCEREGFSVVTAGSVSELATVLLQATPDLVFVDIELPQIPGHRLGTLIRSRHPVPIVLVSALSEDRVRRLFEASDADGWICKPLTREKLIGAVTRFVQKESMPPGEPPAPQRVGPEDARKSILLVEDEPVIAERISFVLAGEWAVTTVIEGETAIRALIDGDFEVTLLDLTLARLSGFDVLRHMVVRQPELLKRTIVMTAANDESLQFIDPKSVGGIVRKPFPVAELPQIVRDVVDAQRN